MMNEKSPDLPSSSSEWTILEKDVPFANSMLWKLQSEAYTQFGMQAWIEKGVPSYLTSNPFTVRQYVNVTLSYLLDCLKPNAKTPIDASAPIFIFDLGAGSGRFAYLYLKQLHAGMDTLGLSKLKICYIITDFVEGNLDFCAKHPYMQSFINRGQLDFALYDHSKKDGMLELIHSQQNITTLQNPAIIIANYFFDTIPQDLFKSVNGNLLTGKISLSVPKSIVNDLQKELDPAWINHLSASYTYSSENSKETYRNAIIDRILSDYRQKFDGTPFLFPTGACQAIEYFDHLSNHRLLLLAGDQGVCTEDQVRTWGEPHIARHGSFSIAVSYHALQSYFNFAGGEALLTSQPDPLFVIMAAVMGGEAADYPQMSLAFKNHFNAFEPSDYWKIINAFENECINPSLEHILTLLKLGNWDPVNFNAFFGLIRSQLPRATRNMQEQLAKAIDNVWEHFYPVSVDEGAFVMNLGVLLFEMKRNADALKYFKLAEIISGKNQTLEQNIAACETALNKEMS